MADLCSAAHCFHSAIEAPADGIAIDGPFQLNPCGGAGKTVAPFDTVFAITGLDGEADAVGALVKDTAWAGAVAETSIAPESIRPQNAAVIFLRIPVCIIFVPFYGNLPLL